VERAFWEASLENVAKSTGLNGEALERRKADFGKPVWISLFQYRIRDALAVNGLSPFAESLLPSAA
jgi:hypothetical protein